MLMAKTKILQALAATALCAVTACHSPGQRNAPSVGTLVFEDVTIVHGTGGPRIERATVVVSGGQFVSVGTDSPSPAAETVRGGFLIPGLIDQHAHVTIRPMTAPGEVAPHMDAAITREVLETLLRFGITTVRNPEAPLPDGIEVREHVKSGRWTGPDVQTAGPALSGGFTPESVRHEVARQAAAGVDWIKVGGAMPPDVLSAAIDEARVHSVRTVGHLQRTTWTDAARTGIDAITHGAAWSPEYLPPAARASYVQTMRGRLDWLELLDVESDAVTEMIRELRERRIPVDPTLIAYDTKFRGNDPRYVAASDLSHAPPILLQNWRPWTFTSDWSQDDYTRGHRLWPKVLTLIRKYWEGGVLLTTGSDFPNPWVVPGPSLHTELELLVSAGIPIADVLAMATSQGAAALGVAEEIGTIAIGRRANAVWLSSDPSVDIRNTRTIRGVLKDGRWVYSPE
jgi:hypothetical protein